MTHTCHVAHRVSLPVGQGTIPVGPPGLASSTPAKPGPDGPGYYLTALRALCVANHPVATDSVLTWRTNCDRNGVFLAAQVLSQLTRFLQPAPGGQTYVIHVVSLFLDAAGGCAS